MVRYDPIRALNEIPRAVDALLDGLWEGMTHTRDEVIREAKGLTDEAAQVAETSLPEHLHAFVGDDDIAYVSAALAVCHCEGWDAVIETVMHQIETEAAVRYQNALLRGDA